MVALKPFRTPNRRQAFSLVELLVVIAIISLLLTLLLPALMSARDKAKNVTCQAQLRTYAMATRMYLGDNNGTFWVGSRAANNLVGKQINLGWDSTNNVITRELEGFQEFYAKYLNGTTADSVATIVNDMRFKPSKLLFCPSNALNPLGPNASGAARSQYAMAPWSASDFRMTETKLLIAQEANPTYFRGTPPALWFDVLVPKDVGNNYGPEWSNHWKSNTSATPAGSNVAHLDGSVIWYDYDSRATPTYPCIVGPLSYYNGQAWPSTSVNPRLASGIGTYPNYAMNMVFPYSTNSGSNYNMVIGPKHGYAINMLPQ